MAKKVCLDPGHYGKYNRSPGIKSYYESEVMWKLTMLQKKHLEERGIEVVLTRTDPAKDLDLHKRGTASKGCDLFISNHTNATGSGKMEEGTDYPVVYHLYDDITTDCDDKSKEIAELLAPLVQKTMGTKQKAYVKTRKSSNDRNKDGIMNDNYYGVLHGARTVGTPAILIEHSFHTNTKTVNWLLNEANLEKLAKAEAECIANYLLKDTPKTLYRVQVGAYSKKENAKAMQKKLEGLGIDSFIVEVKG